ncbi:hypothetical protein [Curtobacterium sp. MCPF17_052]|uniref:hypothetical protein n=1 Tax=Curtobacterium sp. MCPF17_052 TaxID=2175655 RepID=UPI0024DFE9C1|nr:hypothetical protein [Curtobacterium sp. MCPF17_052]WIB12350.1 hypothetical protein DEJ36_16855 [Curtobacterium sp. MCPF17_052]
MQVGDRDQGDVLHPASDRPEALGQDVEFAAVAPAGVDHRERPVVPGDDVDQRGVGHTTAERDRERPDAGADLLDGWQLTCGERRGLHGADGRRVRHATSVVSTGRAGGAAAHRASRPSSATSA